MDLVVSPATGASTVFNFIIAPPSRRVEFLSTYYQKQPWSLPDSLIYYITKNPSSSKCYEKMVQSCKNFFIQNPILVVSDVRFFYEDYVWDIRFSAKHFIRIYVNCLSSKIWIKRVVTIKNYNRTPLNPLPSLIPRIYRNDIKQLNISFDRISLLEFEFLASKCKSVWLTHLVVINPDGSVVKLEKILEMLPHVEIFSYYFAYFPEEVFTSKTVKKLIELPHFLNLTYFKLDNIPEKFDIETFYGYMKKNKTTQISLSFSSRFSEAYKARLQAIVNEFVVAQNHEYKVPYISFYGMDYSLFPRFRR